MNSDICKHGVTSDKWIREGLSIWGCVDCLKEHNKEQNKSFLIMFGMMMGMGMVIIGMMFFCVSFLKYGFQWWNILGFIVTTGIVCLPKYLEYRDTKHLDLTPRFLK